jgi:cobyric acid synthase
MDGAVPLIETSDSRVVGVSSRQGSTWGTYLHGVFDADDFRRWFIDRIRERSGKPRLGRNAAVYDLEPAFDRLADTVRASLDINRIYKLMRLP